MKGGTPTPVLTARGWHVVTVLLFAGLVLAMAWNPR